MPRRGKVPKRDVLPDPMYGSKVVTKLINQIMLDGEKSVAQKIVYDAFAYMGEKMNMDPMEIFKQALGNITPMVEVKARRVGGANYQVPVEIRPERRQTLAIRWLVINTRKRSEREMSKKLAAELMDAYNNTGGSVKKKEDTHRMAEANKAFAHFRF
ncbi:MAG: 30S ribosomal protein S7 [Clostridia bacterium]|nr:30S ribosomal protein S7 [Clostridia bacterium]